MKKTYKSIMSLTSLLAGLLLTSCLGEGNNKSTADGIFTVVKEGGNYDLYADYGGLVRPTNNSVSELTEGEGLKDGDRVYMIYQYTDDNILSQQGKGNYIANAELVQGRLIPKLNIMMKEEAEQKNILDKDSLFKITSDPSSIYFGAYRGYLTTRFSGSFSIVSNKGIYPSINLVYDPEENYRPNELNLKACYNRHTPSNASTATDVFMVNYPLSAISHLITGSDSITINLDGIALPKPIKLKIGREDLHPGNYRYF